MNRARPLRVLAAAGIALVVAAGCGSSDKTGAPPDSSAAPASSAGASGASATTATSLPGSSGGVSDPAFCTQVSGFAGRLGQALAGIGAAAPATVQAEYTQFLHLAEMAPPDLRPSLLEVANYFETAEVDVNHHDTAAIQQIQGQSAKVAEDGQTIAQWIGQHCPTS